MSQTAQQQQPESPAPGAAAETSADPSAGAAPISYARVAGKVGNNDPGGGAVLKAAVESPPPPQTAAQQQTVAAAKASSAAANASSTLQTETGKKRHKDRSDQVDFLCQGPLS